MVVGLEGSTVTLLWILTVSVCVMAVPEDGVTVSVYAVAVFGLTLTGVPLVT